MKKSILLLVVLALTYAFVPSKTKPLTLEVALKQKLIQANISGNSEFTHYTKPLAITLTNTTKKNLAIHLNGGQLFHTPHEQDLVVTEDLICELLPNEKKVFNISSMCIQPNNPAPKTESVYTLGAHSQQYASIAKHMADKKIDGVFGQELIWSLEEPERFFWEEAPERLESINYVRSIKNLPPLYTENPEIEAPRKTRKASFKGFFSFSFSHPHKTHVALFNSNGIVLQEIFEEQTFKGKHKVEYSFNPLEYEGQTLYARLIVDGKIEMEREIVL